VRAGQSPTRWVPSYTRPALLTIRFGGHQPGIDNDSCPVCDDDVPPVTSFGYGTYGEILGPDAHGLLTERTECPACGEPLERHPAMRWHLARCRALV
jgi:hypothetical protein